MSQTTDDTLTAAGRENPAGTLLMRVVVLHGVEAGRVVVLEPGRAVVLGRKPEGEGALQLDDAELSKQHLRFARDEAGRVTLDDLGSRNGTFAQGKRVQSLALTGGEIIRAGTTVLCFERLLLPAGAQFPAENDALPGPSLALARVRGEIALVAKEKLPVLVLGETGVGKELVAESIHRASGVSGAFLPVNCGAIPSTLADSEFFGHEPGAFTGAIKKSPGLFQAAHRGTLFLDEVAELTLDNQAKLLRALQERTVRPLGSNAEVPFDARIIAATHRNLEAEVEAGRFRQDLFFRLNVIRLNLPPLRDRGVDIIHLAAHMLRTICERDGRKPLTLPHDLSQKLLAYPWPGNVRELENCVERLAALGGEVLSVTDLPDTIRAHERERFSVRVEAPEEIVTLDEMEKRYVLRVLTLVKENRARAAQLLGIDRRTLYRRLEGWGLPTERSDRAHASTPTPVPAPAPSAPAAPDAREANAG
jgi:DNA-binding NtrC family response regulator